MSLKTAIQSNKLQFYIQQHPDNICPPVVPKKAYPSDIGYDLTLVRKVNDINSNTTMYDSGISIIPPIGYYIEIVPRSSLSKFGHIMANSIGIIDPSYRGTLRVVLTKVNSSVEDISLPCARFQLILRKINEIDTTVVELDNESNFTTSTERGSGGFGSTD